MRRFPVILLVLALAGCSHKTGALTPAQTQRFASEVVLHRADDARFRYTEGAGRRGGSWDEGAASIVVTRHTIFLHKNQRVYFEVTPSNAAAYTVRRDHGRVAIHTGTGRSAKSWSFEPADDADPWTRDSRAVIKRETVGAAGDSTS